MFSRKPKKNQKTYSADIYCGNCGAAELVKIPFGTSVLKYLETHDEKCEICGICEWHKHSIDLGEAGKK